MYLFVTTFIIFAQYCSALTYHGSLFQAPSPSDIMVLPCQSSPEDCGSNSGDGMVHSSSGRGSNSRWSTLSWDAPSDLLSPPTPDTGGMVHLDSDSRPSSGEHPQVKNSHSALTCSQTNTVFKNVPLNINHVLFYFCLLALYMTWR